MNRLTIVIVVLLSVLAGVFLAQFPVVDSYLPSWSTQDQPLPGSKNRDLLNGLGYLGGYRSAPDETGVYRHDPDATQPGYNFYCGGHGTRAELITMDGEVLHRWSYPWKKASRVISKENKLHDRSAPNFWRQCYLNRDGSVLAIFQGIGLIKLNWNSKLQWARSIGTHHDLDRRDGKIYTLTRTINQLAAQGTDTFPIVHDRITVLTSDGETLERYSILDAILNSRYNSLLATTLGSYQQGQAEVKYKQGDLLHPNSIQILSDTRPFVRQVSPHSGKHALISSRIKDSIFLMSLEPLEVVWTLTNFGQAQHDARLLPNGNLIFFDNWGIHPSKQISQHRIKLFRPRSRVVELNPISQSVAWLYRGESLSDFYSKCCGLTQRLKNGNTLIVESGPGRVIEVTPDGKIVWGFRNPHSAEREDNKIATLFKMHRIPEGFTSSWLSR